MRDALTRLMDQLSGIGTRHRGRETLRETFVAKGLQVAATPVVLRRDHAESRDYRRLSSTTLRRVGTATRRPASKRLSGQGSEFANFGTPRLSAERRPQRSFAKMTITIAAKMRRITQRCVPAPSDMDPIEGPGDDVVAGRGDSGRSDVLAERGTSGMTKSRRRRRRWRRRWRRDSTVYAVRRESILDFPPCYSPLARAIVHSCGSTVNRRPS